MLWRVAHPCPHGTTLGFLTKCLCEQARLPQRWHLVSGGVCGADIYSAVFHVPWELSGQEAPSSCVMKIIYCDKSPFWSLWPWQVEIFVTLVRAQLFFFFFFFSLRMELGRFGEDECCCPGG